MAGAISGDANSVRVLFIRHGQSTNNPLYEGLFQQHDEGKLSKAEVEVTWMQQRKTDPPLTDRGRTESAALGAYLAEGLRIDSNIRVYTSPFRRCLDTTAAMLATFGRPDSVQSIECNPRIYETGGVYTVDKGGKRTGPGDCLSAAEIQQSYPGFGVSQLHKAGQWYTGGWESDASGRERAHEVAGWLSSPEFLDTHKGSVVLLVMHGHFIDTLQKVLVGIPEDPSKDGEGMNSYRRQATQFATPNTATSCFELTKGSVIVRWIGRVDHLRKSPADTLSAL